MPIQSLTPYKLTKTQKKALVEYMEGRKGIQETAAALNVYRSRIYVMLATIARHQCSTGRMDAKEILKNY